jgi:hypothetical protein
MTIMQIRAGIRTAKLMSSHAIEMTTARATITHFLPNRLY